MDCGPDLEKARDGGVRGGDLVWRACMCHAEGLSPARG